MRTMTRSWSRVPSRVSVPTQEQVSVARLTRVGLAMCLSALLIFVGSRAAAQSPTPEGTVITNTATVTFSDANGNSYTPVTGSVAVTVGFVSGIDVTAGAATAAPASPATGATLSFKVKNTGNGVDTATISQSISVSGIISVTGYQINGGSSIATLVLLNTALNATPIAGGDSITITVTYNVASGKGGLSTVLQLTAASHRVPATTDAGQTTITPALNSGVIVTPDGAQNLQKVPSNGVQYTFTFYVKNNGTGTDGFNLVASKTGTAIAIYSVNSTLGTSSSASNVATGDSAAIAVVYTIADVPNGTIDTLRLMATSQFNGGVSDMGFADLTVIRPIIAVTKAAYLDNQSTLLTGSDRVLPGQFIQYKITVTNSGGTSATNVHVDDILPAALTYDAMTADAAGWTFTGSGNTRAADLGGTLAASGTRYFWIRVQVK